MPKMLGVAGSQAAGKKSKGTSGYGHPVDATSADSRYLSALWQKQGGEEEMFSPATLQLLFYRGSIYLTRRLSYVYPPHFTPNMLATLV
jgi:hypothetical protein